MENTSAGKSVPFDDVADPMQNETPYLYVALLSQARVRGNTSHIVYSAPGRKQERSHDQRSLVAVLSFSPIFNPTYHYSLL